MEEPASKKAKDSIEEPTTGTSDTKWSATTPTSLTLPELLRLSVQEGSETEATLQGPVHRNRSISRVKDLQEVCLITYYCCVCVDTDIRVSRMLTVIKKNEANVTQRQRIRSAFGWQHLYLT